MKLRETNPLIPIVACWVVIASMRTGVWPWQWGAMGTVAMIALTVLGVSRAVFLLTMSRNRLHWIYLTIAVGNVALMMGFLLPAISQFW